MIAQWVANYGGGEEFPLVKLAESISHWLALTEYQGWFAVSCVRQTSWRCATARGGISQPCGEP